MSSLHSLIGSGRRALAAKLDRLNTTLITLGGRLKEAVAQALGNSLGEALRDTLLESLAPSTSAHDSPSYYSRDCPRSDPWDRPPSWERNYYETNNAQEHYSAYQEEEEPVAEPTVGRWTVAVASGLRAAAWALRGWWGCCRGGVAVAVGLVTVVVTYLAGPVAEAGLGLAETGAQLSALRQAARTGAQNLNRSP